MPAGVGVLARLGLDQALSGAPFEGVQYHGFGLRMAATFPPAHGCPTQGLGQRRLHLDATLFEAARGTPGVQAFEGATVDGPILEGERVAGLVVEGQEVRAPRGGRRWPAIAPPTQGRARRTTARARTPGTARALPPAPRRHFPAPRRRVRRRGARDLRDPAARPRDRVAALTEDHDGKARTRFAEWLRLHPDLAETLDGAEQSTELAGQMPLESRAHRGVRPGMVLLGDAAGFIDPVTGSGMAQALISAELLASMVAREGRLLADWDTLQEFDVRRRALLRDTSLLTRFVLGMARRPFWARQTLRLMHASPDLYGHLVGVAGGTRPLLPG